MKWKARRLPLFRRYKLKVAAIFFSIGPLTIAPGMAQVSVPTGSPTPEIHPPAQSADQLLAEGTRLLRLKRYHEAIDLLNQACAISPNMAAAHHQKGIALARLGNNNDAIAQFKEAIRINSQLDSSWLSLAGVYQNMGDMFNARRTYREFVSRFPHDRDIDKVRNVLVLLDKESAKSNSATQSLPTPDSTTTRSTNLQSTFNQSTFNRSTTNQSTTNQFTNLQSAEPYSATTSADYYAQISQPEVLRWPKGRLPLRIYVEPGALIPGYRTAFGMLLKRAFVNWCAASKGLLSVMFVTDPASADITCTWSNDPSKFKNAAESATTKLYGDQYGLVKGTIQFLTVSAQDGTGLGDNQMRSTTLHEVGHIFGLAGHSTNPEDVMFLASPLKDSWKELSRRDINTIIRLYSN